MSDTDLIQVSYFPTHLKAEQIDHEVWSNAPQIKLTHYWSGKLAPEERHALVRIIWTPRSLGLRFDCRQKEPLVINPEPVTEEKTIGLWERDVAELFVAPDSSRPNHYFEFEAAPTGEWIDLGITALSDGRETDWKFQSGMTTAARVEGENVVITMVIPWSSDLPKPNREDEWRANLCRCVGSGEDRGYLAWRPTHADKPNFHVPSVFGRLKFV